MYKLKITPVLLHPSKAEAFLKCTLPGSGKWKKLILANTQVQEMKNLKHKRLQGK